MPMLLQELAERSSAENEWAVERLGVEDRHLEERPQPAAAPEELRPHILRFARAATEFSVSRVSQLEGFMRLAVAALSEEPFGDSAEGLLRALLKSFESGRHLVRVTRSFWGSAERYQIPSERLDELDQAERRLDELAREMKRALEHRTANWQPADPARLAQGLQLARDGKTVTADEAQSWFRRS